MHNTQECPGFTAETRSAQRRAVDKWRRRASLRFLPVVLSVVAAVDAAPSRGERPLVFGVNRVGNPELIFNPPDYTEHMYQRIHELGGTMVRLLASPRDVEPQRGKRDWKEFDEDLALALKYGQEPMVLICNIPAWASPTGEACHDYPYKPALLPDFASFCTELAQRTKGKVKYFQLWNEQNGCGWHFQNAVPGYQDGWNHADEYFPMLQAYYKAIKKGNPQAVALMGSFDDAEGHAPIFMNKTYEERKKHAAGAKLFDGITDHPYSNDTKTMKQKLDALKDILQQNGDGGASMFITEYGWHSDQMPENQRAKKMKDFLAKFVTPDWSLLQGAIYLSVSDFEGGNTGFGLCDANLRIRPTGAAFQAASRFGAFPASNIRWKPLAGDKAELLWETLEAATGTVKLKPAPSAAVPEASTLEPSHTVPIAGLAPGTEYEVVITTKSADGKSIDSVPLKFRSAGKEVWNGDFEKGFFAGIASQWTITGPGFCADAALIPGAKPHGGRHAQALVAHRGSALDSVARVSVAAEPGQELTLSAWVSGGTQNTGASPKVRIGIGRAGGGKVDVDTVTWTDWENPSDWRELKVQAKAEAAAVTVFVQAQAANAGDGMAYIAVDDVTIR